MPAKDIFLYSIQSSKGGVGKTTLALNLAKSLEGKKCLCFIFDLDLCGTSISDMMTDPKGNIEEYHIFGDIRVRNFLFPSKSKLETSSKSILEAFLSYISGDFKTNPMIEIRNKMIGLKDDQKDETVILLPSGEFRQENSNGITESQHLLFNENHARWFSDFIFSIIDVIEDNAEPDVTIHIIFDNAPGWSALRPVIENYMIESRYKHYKFIFISSPDEMDILTNVKRICDLWFHYLKKYYAASKFELLKFKCVRNASDQDSYAYEKLLEEYEELEDLDYYDKEFYADLVGSNKESFSEPDLERDIDQAKKDPTDFIHLIINKSAHIEAFSNRLIDLDKIESAYLKSLNFYLEKTIPDLNISPDSKQKEDFERIKKIFYKVILIHFDTDLFFYFQKNFLDTYTAEAEAKPLKKKLQTETKLYDDKYINYTLDFGEVCLIDADFYSNTKKDQKNINFISDQDLTVFLHILRFTKAFHRMFAFLIKCKGDLKGNEKNVPKLLEALNQKILYYIETEKDADSFKEKIKDMVEGVFRGVFDPDQSYQKAAGEYFQLLSKNHKIFLDDLSVQNTLAILFASLFFYQNQNEKIPIYLTMLTELFARIATADNSLSYFAISNQVAEKLKEFGITPDGQVLELQSVTEIMTDVIRSMNNLKNKHSFFLHYKQTLLNNISNDTELQYFKQIFKIFYCRYEFKPEEIGLMINAYLEGSEKTHTLLIDILIREKLKGLGI